MGKDDDPAVPEAQHVLAQHPVEKEGVFPAAHPDLVAVVEVPGSLRGNGVSGGGGVDIRPGEEALALPQPAVHHQLAQLGQVLGEDV